MGNCISSKYASPSQNFVSARSSNLQYEDVDGFAKLNLKNGHYTTEYKLKRPGSPRADETLAGLERRFFQVCCAAPELVSKPRQNLQKKFFEFNAPNSDGRLPSPSA